MSRHESVSCDNCLQTNFEGIRYKCLICYDYDLCEKCHSRGFTTGRHRSDHPMQCILTRLDADLFHRGESSGGTQDAYTCPFCGQYGFKGHELGSHISSHHSGDTREVICPICAVSANTDPNLMTDNLANHMTLEHAQPRRETIRQIRRMIYPSRGSSSTSRRTRATLSSREIPFMQFVSDMTSGSGSGNGMDDSLAELLNHLSGTPRSSSATSRPNQTNSGFLNAQPPPPTQTKKDKSKHPKEESRSISARFLLDTLSDEEDSSPDEFTQQKCDFFQDLLLSTLTSRRLTLNIDPPEESESEVSENEDPVGSSRLMKKCSKKSKDKGLKSEKSTSDDGAVPPMLENNNNRSPEVISSDSDST